MKEWTLYRHTSPSGKVYIGITSKSVSKRWNKGKGYVPCKAFYRAIIKYRWDNIKHEILFLHLKESTAKHLEIELIRHYKHLGISYNITDGGNGFLGFNPSNETRLKMGSASRGRTHVCSELLKLLLSKIHKEKYSSNSIYLSLEFRDKISKIVEYKKLPVA